MTRNGVADYYRSKDGGTVHRADCRLALTGLPWYYAQGKDAAFIELVLMTYDWLHTCYVCRPEIVRLLEREPIELSDQLKVDLD